MSIRAKISELLEREHPGISTFPFYCMLVSRLSQEYDVFATEVSQLLDLLGVPDAGDPRERLRLALDMEAKSHAIRSVN